MVFSLFRTKEPDFEPFIVNARPAPAPAGPCTSLSHTHKERVAMAFRDMPLDRREWQALSALLDHPDSTAIELSRACGWMDVAWRTQMLLLCQRRRQYLWPDGISDDATIGIIITALAEYDSQALTFQARKDLVDELDSAVKEAL